MKDYEARDRKRSKRRYGMRVSGGSMKRVQLDLHYKRLAKEKLRQALLNEDCAD